MRGRILMVVATVSLVALASSAAESRQAGVAPAEGAGAACKQWKADYGAYQCMVAFFTHQRDQKSVAGLAEMRAEFVADGKKACGTRSSIAWSEAATDGDNASVSVLASIRGAYRTNDVYAGCTREVRRLQSAQ